MEVVSYYTVVCSLTARTGVCVRFYSPGNDYWTDYSTRSALGTLMKLGVSERNWRLSCLEIHWSSHWGSHCWENWTPGVFFTAFRTPCSLFIWLTLVYVGSSMLYSNFSFSAIRRAERHSYKVHRQLFLSFRFHFALPAARDPRWTHLRQSSRHFHPFSCPWYHSQVRFCTTEKK